MITQVERAMARREATPAIRGYLYQFDAMISAILHLSDGQKLVVEGIEDFDVLGCEESDMVQCKYYESQSLTPSTLRDAIFPMLKGFASMDEATRNRTRYHLYGHFKGSTPSNRTYLPQDLKQLLIKEKREVLASGEKVTHRVDMRKELGLTDDALELFSSNFELHICSEYLEHKGRVIDELRDAFRVSRTEAEAFLYPSALTAVSALAAEHDRPKRETSKASFMRALRPSRALYSAWVLREKGEQEYCSYIRKNHLAEYNVDTMERFFVIELGPDVTKQELLGLVHDLRWKWSSHSVKRKPTCERYAPYIYFRSLDNEQLRMLKQSLYHDDIRFVDGYPFRGASFSTEHLCQPQTKENQISLRFISTPCELRCALEDVRGQRIIYEFFLQKPMFSEPSCQHVAVPVTSVMMVKQMI